MATARPIRLQFTLLALALSSLAARAAESETPTTTPSAPITILLIRHAEKPDNTGPVKDPNLTPRGYERAEALAKVIPANFAKPDFLFATKRSAHSNRPVETATPLAKALNLKLDDSFAEADGDQLAHSLLTDPKYAGKVILIAWHHGKIPALATALGAKNVPAQWNPAVFDRVWQITISPGGTTFQDLPEKALPGDSQK